MLARPPATATLRPVLCVQLNTLKFSWQREEDLLSIEKPNHYPTTTITSRATTNSIKIVGERQQQHHQKKKLKKNSSNYEELRFGITLGKKQSKRMYILSICECVSASAHIAYQNIVSVKIHIK